MRNRFGLVLTVLGVVLLVTSSVGVTTVALERPVEIAVVEDDSAMVGFESYEPTAGNDSVDLLTVTNRAETALSVHEIELRGTNSSIDSDPVNETIEPGESTTIRGEITCENGKYNDQTTVPVDSTLTGDGVTIERTIDLTVACDG